MAIIQTTEKTPRRMSARLIALALALSPLPGCALVRPFKPPAPASSVTLGDAPAATSTGTQSAPAEISRAVSTSTLTLPAGSVVTVTPETAAPVRTPGKPLAHAAAFSATLAQPATVTTRTETQTAKTATPPAPPSPAETARAETLRDSLRLFVYLGLALGLVAGFLAYSGHYLAAVKIGAAAVAVPALAFWASAHVALIVGAGLVAAGCTAVALWYSHVKPAQDAAQAAGKP